MKNMRIPLFIALGIAVLGLILGSFFDLSISTAIASSSNGFALTISAIGPTIAFGCVAAMGGGYIAFVVKGKYHIALKVLFLVMATACYVVSIIYPGGEYFGINGFYKAAPEWVGYLIVALPEAAAMVGGYFLFRNYKNKNMWMVFLIVTVLLVIVLVAILTPVKSIMRRPRYRVVSVYEIPFHNWWQRCANYKDYMELYSLESDHFKSFPSGHTAEASIALVAMTFFPLVDEKYKKYQLPLFICAGVLVLLVAFARILAAAHYLSDVSMGGGLMVLLLIVTNEIVIRIKLLHIENQPVEE